MGGGRSRGRGKQHWCGGWKEREGKGGERGGDLQTDGIDLGEFTHEGVRYLCWDFAGQVSNLDTKFCR